MRCLFWLVTVVSIAQLVFCEGALLAPDGMVGREGRRGGRVLPPEAWLGRILPLLPTNTTLLDLSLPGTHDSTTYNLSTTVADNANSIPASLASVLHDLAPIINAGLKVGNFLRTQAYTQHLSITDQLNSGIRFVDFRVTYTAPPNVPSSDTSSYEWYGLHLLQTSAPALHLLREIKEWLDAHPTEFVVLWISRHGCACCTDFQVSDSVLQAFWADVVSVFTPEKIVNQHVHPLNTTSLKDLFGSGGNGPQVVMYIAEYDKLTGNNTYPELAQTDCNIDNDGSESVPDPVAISNGFSTIFNQTAATMKRDKAMNQFYLVSMAGALGSEAYYAIIILLYYFDDVIAQGLISPNVGIRGSAAAAKNKPAFQPWHLSRYVDAIRAANTILGKHGVSPLELDSLRVAQRELPSAAEKLRAHWELEKLRAHALRSIEQLTQECATLLNLTGVTDYCPRTIIASSQFKNYYDQLAFEFVVTSADRRLATTISSPTPSPRFPNAIYINAVDANGTIRTGSGQLYPYEPSMSAMDGADTGDHAAQGYYYLDTLVLVTLLQLCNNTTSNSPCRDLIDALRAEREVGPYRAAFWSDATNGRVIP